MIKRSHFVIRLYRHLHIQFARLFQSYQRSSPDPAETVDGTIKIHASLGPWSLPSLLRSSHRWYWQVRSCPIKVPNFILAVVRTVSYSREKFFEILSGTVLEHFKMDMQKLLGHLVPSKGKETVKDVHLRNLMFGDYMDPAADVRIYDEVTIFAWAMSSGIGHINLK